MRRLLFLLLLCLRLSSSLIYQHYDIESYEDTPLSNCYIIRPLDDSPIPFTKSSTPTIHCLPEIFVAGFAKCGTSALFALLMLYPSVIGPPNKEHCIINDNLISYLQGLPSPHEIGNQTHVSGCFYQSTFETIFEVLRPTKSIKRLLIIRNYADLAWASYNYWCEPQLDDNCQPWGRWVTNEHYRSPEMFHELLLAQGKQKGHHLWVPTLLEEAPIHFSKRIQYFSSQVGENNIFVMDSKELETDPEALWKRIAKFLKLSFVHPQMKKFQSRRYNTQDNKGGTSYVSKDVFKKDIYPVSGNRPMLKESRKILNVAWKPDCVWLKHTYYLPTLKC